MHYIAVPMFHQSPHIQGMQGCTDTQTTAPQNLNPGPDTVSQLQLKGSWAGLRGCLDALKIKVNFSPATN